MSLLVPGTAGAVERRLTPEPERDVPNDPVEWVRQRTDEHPWSRQREWLRSVQTNRATALPSCHGPGKTKAGGWLVNWWLDGAPIGSRRAVTTAPTGDQVKGLLWKEVAQTKLAAAMPGHITGLKGSGAVRWHVGEVEVAIGRRPQDLTNLDQARQAFSGYHATDGVLVIVDEATGVPEWIWQALTSLLTSDRDRIVAFGNPDDPSSRFAEVCAPGTRWHTIHTSAFECPNFTNEAVPEVVKRATVSKQWVEDAEEDYGGKDNPLYVSKVLGQFPDTSDNLVITPRMIREAWANDLPGSARGAYGLDVARSPTGDESALYRNRGGVVRFIDAWRGLPITAKPGAASTVDRTWGHCKRTPAVPIVVDVDGLGAGAFDGLVAIDGCKAAPFSSSGPARRKDRFDSRRSELWWEFRGRMLDGSIDLDELDPTLAAQLQTLRWDTRGGRIHVETKDELAKRGKKSPDRADAAIMSVIGEPMNLSDDSPDAEAKRQQRARAAAKRKPDGVRIKRGEGAALRNRPM